MSAGHQQAQLDSVLELEPKGACINYATCQNLTPGGVDTGNEQCDECLARARGLEET